ncbi:hypothetical protein Q7P37_005789 [Cladosporium fusiforme]
MARLRSAKAPSPATTDATRRPILREKTNTMGTPGPAAETSMLALKNFKRRPRQGSMLEMVKHRRSSVARQSLAASVLQQQEDDQEDTSVFDLGSASEDEEEAFAPEAEGTPVHLNKTRKSVSARKPASAAKSDAPRSSTKRNKRKSGEMEDSSHSALDALRKKHRKSEPSHIEDELLPADDETTHSADHALSDRQTSPVPDRTVSEVQVVNSSPRHSSPLTSPASSRGHSKAGNADFAVPSTEEQERAQRDLDDDELDVVNATMAEPVSSSPVASPIPETQRTDIYADPQTQVSPPPPEPAKTRSQNKKQPASLSTAKLRALLPRRTQKPQPRPSRRTEYDIPSDEGDDDDNSTAFETTHLDDDEDELGGRLRRKAKAQTTQTKKKPTATAKAKPKPAASTTRKGATAPQPPAKTKGKGKATRTYGRATTTLSDKENAGADDESPEPSSATEQDEDDTTLTMRESVAHSKELEEARRKFAEVDEWDLSFESMSNEDHRSSSQNWR